MGAMTFGNFKLGRIHGYKYEDTNGNGVWDEGEGGVRHQRMGNMLSTMKIRETKIVSLHIMTRSMATATSSLPVLSMATTS